MKMKQTALKLMFFMSLTMFFTGCGTFFWSKEKSVEIISPRPEKTKTPDTAPQTPSTPTTPTTPTNARFIPITWDIVKDMQQNGINYKELHFYLSKPLSITIIERNNAPRKMEINNGTLIVSKEQSSLPRRLEFSSTDFGTLRSPMENSSEIFVIDFKAQENEIPLRFQRNSQGRYDLISAEIEKRPYNIRSEDGVPQLFIPAELNEHLEAQLVFTGNEQRRSIQQFTYEDSGRRSYDIYNAGSFTGRPSRNIDGDSYVNKRGISAYMARMNPSVKSDTLNRLIDTYISEAEIEGINLDIAIAQMLYATKNLGNSQRMASYNYAGLSSTPGWNGRFPNKMADGMTEGVRAHIQHLKLYSSGHLNKPLVDPRYQILAEKGYLGKVRTFDRLYSAWSPNNNNYGKSIDEILDSLYLFSNN